MKWRPENVNLFNGLELPDLNQSQVTREEAIQL